ncbi:MAG: cupin domain-containing protein [Chloroflexi bacterium]|nr:cupin domain-containing protein [Chloroflexota bacterium]
MPKFFFASPRDLAVRAPAPGVVERVVPAEHASILLVDLDPRTVIETHKHDVEEIGVILKGSIMLVIAGEQRILTRSDSYRVPPGTSHGARVFEQATQVLMLWAPKPESP